MKATASAKKLQYLILYIAATHSITTQTTGLHTFHTNTILHIALTALVATHSVVRLEATADSLYCSMCGKQ